MFDMGNVEQKMLYNQGHLVLCQNYVNENDLLKEKARLQNLQFLPEVQQSESKRFALLRKSDLNFTIPEIAISNFFKYF